MKIILKNLTDSDIDLSSLLRKTDLILTSNGELDLTGIYNIYDLTNSGMFNEFWGYIQSQYGTTFILNNNIKDLNDWEEEVCTFLSGKDTWGQSRNYPQTTRGPLKEYWIHFRTASYDTFESTENIENNFNIYYLDEDIYYSGSPSPQLLTSEEDMEFCKETIIEFYPPYDYEIIGGKIRLSTDISPIQTIKGCQLVIAPVSFWYIPFGYSMVDNFWFRDIDCFEWYEIKADKIKEVNYESGYRFFVVMPHDEGLQLEFDLMLKYYPII